MITNDKVLFAGDYSLTILGNRVLLAKGNELISEGFWNIDNELFYVSIDLPDSLWISFANEMN